MKKVALLAVLCFAGLPLTGCPSATLQNAALASENSAIIVQGLESSEIAAHNQGLIPDADHQFIQQEVVALAGVGKTVDSCIGSAGTTTGAVSCINTAVAQVTQMQADGALHLKSSQAQSDFSIAMSGVKTALLSVETTLNGQAAPKTSTTTP